MTWGGSGHIEVAGQRLEYETYGALDAPTIVMLHEGLGCVALWRGWPEKLAQATGYSVLVYSRASYGQSDPAPMPRALDYMHEEAKVLGAVIDHFDLKKVVLFGHSDGGTISAIYAGSNADMRLRGLILMAPHFFHEDMGLEAIAKAGEAFKTGGLRDRLSKYHKTVDAAFHGWHDSWLHPDNKDWNDEEVIDYFRIPTLAIQGSDDPYGSYAQISVIEERSYAPVDVLWLEGCGHAPFLEAPEPTLDSVVDFCARLRRIEEIEVAL